MLKFISKYFGLYYSLFFVSYISVYFFPGFAAAVNVFILLMSYWMILKRQRLDVVIILILYSRCMNGFIIPHDKTAYLLINLLTNVVPFFLYLALLALKKKIGLNLQLFTRQYRFTTLFFLLLTIGFILNFSISYDLVTKRYLPFMLFLLFLLFFKRTDFNVYGLIRFLRATFFASLLLYFSSSYLPITRLLIESDSVFSVSSEPNSYSLIYMSFTRNMGFFWDHRILAIYSYLYLLLVIAYKPKYFRLDILLSLIIVITTTSRGGMVTYALIMFVYLLQVYRVRFLIFMGIAASVLIFALIIAGTFLPSSTLYFLNSFNPNSEYNAMSQRQFFSDYAMEAFQEKPVFGNGVGFLSSHLIDRHLVVDGAKVPAVTDAYWYVLLAEMGILGFVMYLLFLVEVFYSNKLLSIALLIGFSIQLLGTDIPDMRFYYFAILVTVYIINLKFRKISLNARNYAEA